MSNILLMERAYAKLRNKLEAGELAPGTRLVNRALGKELGVSTVTLREAIHRLSSEGILEHVPNAGAFVRKLSRREAIETCELRNALEMFAIEKAFANIDEEQLARLDEICGEWRKAAESIRGSSGKILEDEARRRWIALDFEFHDILADASDNGALKKMVANLRSMSLQIASTNPLEINLSFTALSYRLHAGIVRGLRKRNWEQARFWMDKHNSIGLTNARRWIAKE